jgi:hypothetical protein
MGDKGAIVVLLSHFFDGRSDGSATFNLGKFSQIEVNHLFLP